MGLAAFRPHPHRIRKPRVDVGGGFRIPKRDLISATLVLLQNGRLKIAEALKLRDTLVGSC